MACVDTGAVHVPSEDIIPDSTSELKIKAFLILTLKISTVEIENFDVKVHVVPLYWRITSYYDMTFGILRLENR